MPQVRIRNKHQITIPKRIADEARLKTDDLLEVSYRDGQIILKAPGSGKPAGSVMDYAGICRGMWGGTTGEIQAELARERDSWER